jgi:peptidyl-dipeptidase A
MKTKILCLLMAGVFMACCKSEKQPVAKAESPLSTPAQFVEWYSTTTAQIEDAAAVAYWKAANSGQKADFDDYAAKSLALKTHHSNKEQFEQIKSWLASDTNLTDIERRVLEVAFLAYQENQVPKEDLEAMVNKLSEIEQTFNTYRATLDGKNYTNNDLLEMLAKETDTAKRQAIWEALKQVGEQVGAKLIELAKIRNAAARKMGFANYWEMAIKSQAHDPQTLLTLFDRLEAETRQPFADMKAELDAELSRRFGIPPEAMMPWHYDNPFFQDAPPNEAINLDVFYAGRTKEDIVELGRKFFEDLGLEFNDIVANSDFFEREGKDQHAFCITLDRGGDVRMLLNIKPTADWMDTMLHESGHAVYYKYIDRSLPYNLREAAHIFTTEAIAMMMGALAKNPTFLIERIGADPAKVEEVRPAILEQRRREQLIFARWAMVMFSFERQLYENPDQNLNSLWWDTVEKFQMLKRPADRNLADWAAKPHFTIAPVYYHNYLLGELLAAQLRGSLAQKLGHTGPTWAMSYSNRPEIGKALIETVFEPGMRYKWEDFVKKATGKPLGPEDYVAEVSKKAD